MQSPVHLTHPPALTASCPAPKTFQSCDQSAEDKFGAACAPTCQMLATGTACVRTEGRRGAPSGRLYSQDWAKLASGQELLLAQLLEDHCWPLWGPMSSLTRGASLCQLDGHRETDPIAGRVVGRILREQRGCQSKGPSCGEQRPLTLPSLQVPTKCEPGCACAEGLYEDPSGECVPPEQCPCDFAGVSYPGGAKLHTDCKIW